MTKPVDHAQFAEALRPAARRNRADHVFDLPPALHIATFGAFFAYLGIMWAAFGEAELGIPFAIFAIFLAGAFVVPAWWARIAPPAGPTGTLADFMREGMTCATGHVTGGQAVTQVLIMPVMLLIWGSALLVISLTL